MRSWATRALRLTLLGGLPGLGRRAAEPLEQLGLGARHGHAGGAGFVAELLDGEHVEPVGLLRGLLFDEEPAPFPVVWHGGLRDGDFGVEVGVAQPEPLLPFEPLDLGRPYFTLLDLAFHDLPAGFLEVWNLAWLCIVFATTFWMAHPDGHQGTLSTIALTPEVAEKVRVASPVAGSRCTSVRGMMLRPLVIGVEVATRPMTVRSPSTNPGVAMVTT